MLRALVWTAWDLGIRDQTAIWFAQVVGKAVHLIDYCEAAGVDLGHDVRELDRRGYTYGGQRVPQDAQGRELGSGKSRFEVMQSLGCKNLRLAPLHRVEDGINAVRLMPPRCWFDQARCARGIEALRLYRTEYDARNQVLRPHPVHGPRTRPTRSGIWRCRSTTRPAGRRISTGRSSIGTRGGGRLAKGRRASTRRDPRR